ncbi:hypothetical protein [Streptomyces sp. NPDC048623]|uniref:hypothetical protein n=1 Tax=Streptomyces sp. NPDC048623 TaxID=3155761 RepID=UPI00342AA375
MYELMRLARGGVLLTVRAYEAGWSRGRLRGRLRREGWQPIWRGAWAAPGKEVDWRERARIIQLLRPDLVCSHVTAAALHRIERLNSSEIPEVLEFTTHRPGPAGISTRSGIRVHSTPFLTEADNSVRAGLRVTTPPRTVADLIRAAASREEAVVAADSALARRTVQGVRREPLVRQEQLADELIPRRPGTVRARAWLRLTDPAAGSPAETIARLHMHDAGLHPESQPPLRTRSGRTLHPDFLFREAGLAVEIEGYAFHGTRRAHERDIARFNALTDCQEVRRVLRFTATDVFRHPERVIGTIRRALED